MRGNTKCVGCGTGSLLLSVLHRAAAAAAAASLFAEQSSLNIPQDKESRDPFTVHDKIYFMLSQQSSETLQYYLFNISVVQCVNYCSLPLDVLVLKCLQCQ